MRELLKVESEFIVLAAKPSQRVMLSEEGAKRILAIKPHPGQRERYQKQAAKLNITPGGVKR